jgi:hypothetical protein
MPAKKQRILKLKPTQFAVGMLEVQEKIDEVLQMERKAKKKFVRENPVPVVLSPRGDLYIVDHHHFLVVCLHTGIETVRIEIVKDLSKKRLSYKQFWTWMKRQKFVYPFCQFGEGPRDPIYLPLDVRGLADDPYRSLAWFVRKEEGAYEKSEKNFAEFQWANFFRAKKLLDKRGMEGFEAAQHVAARLARSGAARDLPGFDGLSKAKAKEKKKKPK